MRFNKIVLFAAAMASSSFASRSGSVNDRLIFADLVFETYPDLEDAIHSVWDNISFIEVRELNESMVQMGPLLMARDRRGARSSQVYKDEIMHLVEEIRSRISLEKSAGGSGGGAGGSGHRIDDVSALRTARDSSNVQAVIEWDNEVTDGLNSIEGMVTPAEAKELAHLLTVMGNSGMLIKVAEGENLDRYMTQLMDARTRVVELIHETQSRRMPERLADSPPHVGVSRINKTTRDVKFILDNDLDLAFDLDHLEDMMTEEEARDINEALLALGNLAMRIRSGDVEIIEQLMADSTQVRNGLNIILDQIKARIPLPHREIKAAPHEGYIVGIDYRVSDQCIAQPFKDQLMARFREFEEIKAAPPRVEIKPHKPLEQMTEDEQMEFMLRATVGSNLVEEKFELHARPGWIGIRNLGNTCYLGSILQVFLHTDAFVNLFLTRDRRSVRRDLLGSFDYTTSSFSHLVQQMWFEAGDHGGEPLVPADLLCSLHQGQRKRDEFVVGRQADAHEAINLILNQLAPHVGLDQIMANRVIANRGCHSCGVNRPPRVVESFELLIPIPEVRDIDTPITLEACIHAWKQAFLEFSGCCAAGRAFENSAIQSTKELVLIELVRFRDQDHKIHTLIDIPVKLQLMVGDLPRWFRLVGFVNHSGNNQSSGHYSSTVYHPTEAVWLLANDRSVSVTEVAGRVGRISSRQAYLLMYQEIPAGEFP